MREVVRQANDPDLEIADWLRDGAPMGIAQDIVPGRLQALVDEASTALATEMQELASWEHNHASFDFEEDPMRPALGLLQEHVDNGFATLYRDQAHAEQHLECRCVPSPLGDVITQKEDGTWKHRLIMDLSASKVNMASKIHERQVLPRHLDHAHALSRAGEADEESSCLILDFQNAFMSIPLHQNERPFNCTVVPQGGTTNETSTV